MKNIIYICATLLLIVGCSGNIEELAQSPIQPPFNGVEVPFSTYVINPTEDVEIETNKGTLITIPANSIVNQNGEIAGSDVQLNYRSFHSFSETIISGIPMQYDSLGKTYDFNSSGMFELTATDENGNPLFLKKGSEIDMEFAAFNDADEYSLYELNENTGDWTFLEPSKAIENERKSKKIQSFKDEFIITLDVDYRSNPELAVFDEMSWVYVGGDVEKDPAENEWIFEEIWRSISLERLDDQQAIYNLNLRSVNNQIDLEVSPYILGDEESFLAELDNGILAYNDAVKKRKDEELMLQMQADFVRKFSISSFGICNIDRINRMLQMEEIYVTNGQFMLKDGMNQSNHKIMLFNGKDKTMVTRTAINWEEMYFSDSEQNSLLIVLPNNEVAICGQEQFEKAKLQSDYTFEFSTYKRIESKEDLDELIASL